MPRNKPLTDLKNTLKRSFLNYEKIREGRHIITLKKKMIQEAAKILVKKNGARFSALSAVDLGLDIELLYHFSIKGEYYTLKTLVPKEDLQTSSIANIIPGANWSEREVQDLFGMNFENHPDPRTLFLPFEWSKDSMPLKKPMRGILSSFQTPTIENLLNQGIIFPLSGLTKRIRSKLNLDEVPATAAAKLEDLKEVQRLIMAVQFDRRVGFDWIKRKMRY